MIDWHSHILPGVDDGARSIEESLEMLNLAKQQGVTDVFCTSHNGYSFDDGEAYLRSFSLLKQVKNEAGIQIKLHKGCEVLSAGKQDEVMIFGMDYALYSENGFRLYQINNFLYQSEWDYIEEVWVCDDFNGEYDAEAVARSRYEDMLCEQGKNEAKGVSDEVY